MVRHLSICAAVLMLALAPMRSQAAEEDPRGAVGCLWMLYATLERNVRACDIGGDDPEFFEALQSGVDRIEAFIFRNSDTTEADLERFLVRHDELAIKLGIDICAPQSETLKMYKTLREHFGAEGLTRNINEVLEVERPVLSNPCL